MKKRMWKSILSGVLAASLLSSGIPAFAAEDTQTLSAEADECLETDPAGATPEDESPDANVLSVDDTYDADDEWIDEEDEYENLAGDFDEEEDFEFLDEGACGDGEDFVEAGEEIPFEEEDAEDSLAGYILGAVDLKADEELSFDYPAGSFVLTYAFTPDESAIYRMGLNLPNGKYEVDWEYSVYGASTGSQETTGYKEGDDEYEGSPYTSLFTDASMAAGQEYKITLRCDPVDAEAGTGSVVITKNEAIQKTALTLNTPAGMQDDIYYVFTAPESGVYKIAIDATPTNEVWGDDSIGNVDIRTPHDYCYGDIKAKQQTTTESFILRKGEDAIIRLERYGSEVVLQGTITPTKTNECFVIWDAGDDWIGIEWGYDQENDKWYYNRFTHVYIRPSNIYKPGEYLYSDYVNGQELKKDGYTLAYWYDGKTGEIVPEAFTDDDHHVSYRVNGVSTLYPKWAKIVPVIYDANGKKFTVDKYDSDAANRLSEDSTKYTVKGMSGLPLPAYHYFGEFEEWASYQYYADSQDGCYLKYWSTDAEGKNKVEFDNEKEYFVDGKGNPLVVGEDGLTLYANWYEEGTPSDPSSSGIVFDKWDQEVKGQFGVPMTLSTRAYYDGADPLVYLWTEDGTPLPAQSTADGVSTCTYTPKRRSHYIEVKATAYDENDNEITSGQCYIFVYCEDNAKVTNPTNTVKIAKNGSKTLNVTASGTTGKLSYVWYWYDKTKTVTDNDGYTHYDEHSIPDAVTTSASYTVKNYSDTNIVYGCEVIDERGYVGNAEFAFELCTSHTGSWVVTKQPTTAAEGQETRTCTTCGYVETRSVAKLPAPAAPVKQPVSASIKASKTSVKLGKKATIKITSDSGAKLTVKAKSKNAKNKKYVKITSGKTAKLAFTKKAPKGTYKFTVTSPASGNYKKTTKTISIKIK